MFTTEVLDGPVTTNKKAHDIIVGASPFLRSDSKLSRFRLSEEKRKRFMSICYNFSFSFWCSLGFGAKFGINISGCEVTKIIGSWSYYRKF